MAEPKNRRLGCIIVVAFTVAAWALIALAVDQWLR